MEFIAWLLMPTMYHSTFYLTVEDGVDDEDGIDDGNHFKGDNIDVMAHHSSIRDQSFQRLLDSIKNGTLQSKKNMLSIDLGVLLHSTNAAIKIDQEIWDRISQVAVKPGVDAHESILAKLVYFPKIRLSKFDGDKVILEAQAHYQSWQIDSSALFKLSAELEAIFPLDNTRRDTLPNYGQYLDRASLLHDNILVPFLWKFKEFLEDVHVFLGEIESKISAYREPCAQFLEDTFQIAVRDSYWRDSYVFRELFGQEVYQCNTMCVCCNRHWINRSRPEIEWDYHLPASIELQRYDCPRNFEAMTVEFDIREAKGQNQVRKFLSIFMDSQLVNDPGLDRCINNNVNGWKLTNKFKSVKCIPPGPTELVGTPSS